MESAEYLPVIFAGDMTIHNIDSIKAEIRAAVVMNVSVMLDISGVTDADLTFIQLVESARQRVGEAGRDLTLRHPAAGAVLEVLQRGGFLDEGSGRAKFWLQGATKQ